jgi:sRNA-binding carbon storage regulator CsrA
MKFLEVGEGAEIGILNVRRNVMVVDDISTINTFISIGKNGKITHLDAEGNEVHTPASYAKKLEIDRGEFFAEVERCKDSIDQIKDELLKARLKDSIAQASQQELDAIGEHRFKQIIKVAYEIAKNTGAAVLATCICAYIGYVPS